MRKNFKLEILFKTQIVRIFLRKICDTRKTTVKLIRLVLNEK